MKSIRLLPIVVFASLALLAFKTIGLVTSGGYVLTGTTEVAAAGGGGGHSAPAEGEAASPGETITIPPEPTLEDQSPTIDDGAPTMALNQKAAAGGHGEAAPAAGEGGGHGAEPAPEPEVAVPDLAADPAAEAGHGEVAQDAGHGDATDHGDAAAADAQALAEGQPLNETERTILNRLAERRTELDSIEGELATRQQLVEAAEQKLAERTAALQAIEARINGMVDQQKAVDEAQFKSLVSMYENMKPADAAKIFDSLDVDVLVRVAKAINPRKMAPIMAKMSPTVAQVLTIQLAAVSPITQPTTIANAGLPSDLPQIVGQ